MVEAMHGIFLFKSDALDKLAAALSKAQGEIKSAAKDSVNPHFKSHYADLASLDEASKEALAKNGLSIVQMPRASGRQVTLVYLLLHESGQYLGSDCMMTAQQDTPQAVGSCITYLRRYTKAALVGISQSDDDGNEASHRTETSKPEPEKTPAKKAEPVLYDGKTANHKNHLFSIAKRLKVTSVDDLAKLNQACIGLAEDQVEAAVKEWLKDNNRA